MGRLLSNSTKSMIEKGYAAFHRVSHGSRIHSQEQAGQVHPLKQQELSGKNIRFPLIEHRMDLGLEHIFGPRPMLVAGSKFAVRPRLLRALGIRTDGRKN